MSSIFSFGERTPSFTINALLKFQAELLFSTFISVVSVCSAMGSCLVISLAFSLSLLLIEEWVEFEI